MYKEFGIYIDKEIITVLVDVKPNCAFGIDYYLDEYLKNKNDISNESVNSWLFANFDSIGEEQVFRVDLIDYPKVLYDYGYLGRVNDSNLQKKMKDFTKVVWTDIDWSR